jgi:tetratricopeptide (TPR) repeat protein
MSVTFCSTRLILTVLAFSLLGAGCAARLDDRSDLLPATQLLQDQAFPQFSSYYIEQAHEIFALDDDAKAFVAQTVKGSQSDEEKIAKLIHRIFSRSELDLIYTASADTVASETFQNASANCLSLSIMTFSMAKEAGFSSKFQIVDIPEYWTRRGGYSLLNGHINLQIKPFNSLSTIVLFEKTFVVDFDPSDSTGQFLSRDASKQVVLAMFYNNKGAEALIKQKNDLAYAYFRESILADDSYPGAWVNLGLLYKKQGLNDLAMDSYQRAISLDEDHNTAWENLAILYQQLGNLKAASDINRRLDVKRSKNPFYHQMLAEIDRENGSLESSIHHYERAIRLNRNQHQFYFGLASVYFEKGDFERSERFLKLAKKKAGKSKVADIYVNKLDALSSFIASAHIN